MMISAIFVCLSRNTYSFRVVVTFINCLTSEIMRLTQITYPALWGIFSPLFGSNKGVRKPYHGIFLGVSDFLF